MAEDDWHIHILANSRYIEHPDNWQDGQEANRDIEIFYSPDVTVDVGKDTDEDIRRKYQKAHKVGEYADLYASGA